MLVNGRCCSMSQQSIITSPAKRSRASTLRQGPSYFPIPMPPALCVYPQVKPHITTYHTSITAVTLNIQRGYQTDRCQGVNAATACMVESHAVLTEPHHLLGQRDLLQSPKTAFMIVGTTVEYPPQPVRAQLLLHVDGEPAARVHPSAWLLILRYAAQKLGQHYD